jgi:hypothetical protein
MCTSFRCSQVNGGGVEHGGARKGEFGGQGLLGCAVAQAQQGEEHEVRAAGVAAEEDPGGRHAVGEGPGVEA